MLTGTNSVYYRGVERKRLCIIRTPGARLETGVSSWKQGRKPSTVDQTKIRTKESCPKERVGRDGAKRRENGRTGYEKHRPSGKIERRSTVRVAWQVWVQRAANPKRVARKKPIPNNRKVKSGGHVRVDAGRTKRTHPNKYASIGHTALCNERSRRRTVIRITPKKNKDRREKDKLTAHPRRKTQLSGTLGLLRLGKDASGGGGLKSRKCREKKIGRPRKFLRNVVPSPNQ